jgi:hypothetical protein
MTTGPRPGLRVQGKVRGTRDVDLAMGTSHFEHFVNAKCLARSAPPALPGFFVGSDSADIGGTNSGSSKISM